MPVGFGRFELGFSRASYGVRLLPVKEYRLAILPRNNKMLYHELEIIVKRLLFGNVERGVVERPSF